jgi:uncharacterized membrane protein
MTRRSARKWAALAIALSVALWIAQALIGLNWYDEEDAYPWFLRAVQWIALGLVLASLPVLVWTLMRSPRSEV